LKKLRSDLEVESAGVFPANFISNNARSFLEKEGALSYLKKFPQGLNEKDLDKFDLIIAMETEHKKAVLRVCPRCERKIIVWNINDPYFLPDKQSEKIFQQIKLKVEEMAVSLDSNTKQNKY